jgi:hypothetical protein
MLLLGALLILMVAGFWLYCLVDVALAPGSECRGLPKAAWIAIVAGTFAVGAAVWLGFRDPARPTRPIRSPGGTGREVRSPAGLSPGPRRSAGP